MVTENFGIMNLKDSKKIQKLKAMEERLLKTKQNKNPENKSPLWILHHSLFFSVGDRQYLNI